MILKNRLTSATYKCTEKATCKLCSKASEMLTAASRYYRFTATHCKIASVLPVILNIFIIKMLENNSMILIYFKFSPYKDTNTGFSYAYREITIKINIVQIRLLHI